MNFDIFGNVGENLVEGTILRQVSKLYVTCNFSGSIFSIVEGALARFSVPFLTRDIDITTNDIKFTRYS